MRKNKAQLKLKISNGYYKRYSEKNVLIIVPHQDDELFLCGTIIGAMVKASARVYIVFLTNGDYENEFKLRKKQCIAALKNYGIRKSNIFFLGYGDQYNTVYGHIYHALQNTVVSSHCGKTETYGGEFCYLKHGIHHDYTLANLADDFKEIIETILPEFIFCNDLDWHPDHRACSLLFDSVMGKILKSIHGFYPTIYKGFVYYIGWDGELDYKTHNLASTKRPRRFQSNDKRFALSNPYFEWKNRIRLPVDSDLLLYKHNMLYKALKKYKFSDNALSFYDSMMNSDAVFWERNSRNLCLVADINVSSGDSYYLNDFILLDSSNIMKAQMMPYDKGAWMPDTNDTYPEICIRLQEKKVVKKLVFYRDVESYGKEEVTLDVRINGEGQDDSVLVNIGKFDTRVEYVLSKKNEIKTICMKLSNNLVGFTEIEVIVGYSMPYVKIMIGNDFVYHYFINDATTRIPINLLTVNCVEKDLITHIRTAPGEVDYAIYKDGFIYVKDGFKECYLEVYDAYNNYVYDCIKIERQ